VSASKQVLELLSIKILISNISVVLDHKQSGMSHCLGRRQELAFLFNVLSITSRKRSWTIRFFSVDALNELIQVEGDRELLHRVAIGKDNKVIAFFVKHPQLTFSKLSSVDA